MDHYWVHIPGKGQREREKHAFFLEWNVLNVAYIISASVPSARVWSYGHTNCKGGYLV